MRGVPVIAGSEIIPIEPDPDNTGVGNGNNNILNIIGY